jgi:hypothetical protein
MFIEPGMQKLFEVAASGKQREPADANRTSRLRRRKPLVGTFL